jgi:protein import protein ZIM17
MPEEDVKSDKEIIAARKALQPCYDMTFTCKKCLDRSSHRITKQAYHFGTVLVNCPGCKSRHLIADHMKVRYARRHAPEQGIWY